MSRVGGSLKMLQLETFVADRKRGWGMNTNMVRDSRFLGALGFLGFLGLQAFTGTRYAALANAAPLSLLALVSLGVLLPRSGARVEYPVGPRRQVFLLGLLFLPALFFLFGERPLLAQFALFSLVALGAIPQSSVKGS